VGTAVAFPTGVVAGVGHSKVVADPIGVDPRAVAHTAVVVAGPTVVDRPAVDHIAMVAHTAAAVALVAILDYP
jgi:hypothetical protein